MRAPTVPVPTTVRTTSGPAWSRMTLVPGGSSASTSSAVGGGCCPAPGGGASVEPNESRSVGSCCTGASAGRVSTAWAVPISRSARSSGVSVKVSA
jgi:hypothetical protein